ncbi:MAG: Mrp/NBP35 family ATP-binding protein [Acholeplasmatales bacterium]|nr:Mrp/NBP35 family ATP-binding protein [Acholeplasmatales bacterium]
MACDHNCSNCKSACDKNKSLLVDTAKENNIKNIIGIVSGKGGVGKSTVTSLIAVDLAKKGYKVGILDSDITGPSIPKAFGVTEEVTGNDKLMFPPVSRGGIKVMSINLLIDDPTKPVLWRGPVIGNAIKQFYSDVFWGELDYLLIDMPPGTGDVALTVFQSIPVDGVVIVSTPQDLVKMIVGKAVNMCKQMNIKIIGLVENMSYMECPCCGEFLYPFGPSKLKEVAEFYNIKPLCNLPISTRYAELIDDGDVELIDTASTNIEEAIKTIENFN